MRGITGEHEIFEGHVITGKEGIYYYIGKMAKLGNHGIIEGISHNRGAVHVGGVSHHMMPIHSLEFGLWAPIIQGIKLNFVELDCLKIK